MKDNAIRSISKSVVVRVSVKGYMTDDMEVKWYCPMWLLRPMASLRSRIPNLLVLDFI